MFHCMQDSLLLYYSYNQVYYSIWVDGYFYYERTNAIDCMVFTVSPDYLIPTHSSASFLSVVQNIILTNSLLYAHINEVLNIIL